MAVRRGVPSLALSLLVVLALAVGAPSASATSLDKVTGGQSALFVPFSNIQKLGSKGIFVSPISPAFLTFTSFQEGPAIRFPISGGLVESGTMLGTVDHAGGMLIQKINPDGTVATQLEVTVPRILNGNMLIGNALGLIPAPTADLVNATHSKDSSTGVISFEADAQVSLVTATILNTYFSTDVFEGGMILGHLKSNIETEPVLAL
jgi:hypothetical protein